MKTSNWFENQKRRYKLYCDYYPNSKMGFIRWFFIRMLNKSLIWKVQNSFYDLSDRLLKLAGNLPGKKVYAGCFSRDCDMFERTWAQEFKNIWAFRYAARHFADDAEGACNIWRISKSEYEGFTCSHRDRVMEAYENGRGNSIYV